jgi:hypothetical protein
MCAAFAGVVNPAKVIEYAIEFALRVKLAVPVAVDVTGEVSFAAVSTARNCSPAGSVGSSSQALASNAAHAASTNAVLLAMGSSSSAIHRINPPSDGGVPGERQREQALSGCIPSPYVSGVMSTLRWLALFAIATLPSALEAQTVRGTLTAAGSRERINGGIVALLDDGGRVVTAAMSDDSGSYELRAPAAGRYTLRVERVGFRTTLMPAFALAEGQTLELPVEVTGEAVSLRAVKVVAEKRCVVRPQQGLVAADLWNEARKALNATQLTRQQRFAVRLRKTERDLRPFSLEPTRAGQFEEEGESTSPFVSVPHDTLRKYGFRRRNQDGTFDYFAPDADILLSDTFLDSHCLLALPPARGGLVGLMFEPVPGRKLPEVKGVLWFDPSTAELRFLQFQYVNLDLDVPTEDLGGRLDFTRLPNGRWIVRRWYIRMPVVRAEQSGLGTFETSRRETRQILEAIREVGGELLEVLPAGRARASHGTLAGVVTDSLRGAPLAGARVVVSGTSLSATVDSQGRYRIDSVPPGDATVSLVAPRLDSLLLDAPALTVSVSAGRTAAADLAIPSLESLVRSRCPAAPPGSDSLAMVFGYVRDAESRRPVGGARVRATWEEFTKPMPERLLAVTLASEATTDANGRFSTCGIPLGKLVQVRAIRGRQAGPVVHLRPARREPYRIDPELTPP